MTDSRILVVLENYFRIKITELEAKEDELFPPLKLNTERRNAFVSANPGCFVDEPELKVLTEEWNKIFWPYENTIKQKRECKQILARLKDAFEM